MEHINPTQLNLFSNHLQEGALFRVRSPLNYLGGKYKLLDSILPVFPSEIDTFVDLFCGGCNVGINVRANQHLFNDNLVYLIDLYNILKETDESATLDYLDSRIESLDLNKANESGYLRLRREYNNSHYPFDLFLLIAYSFNHQIRFNSSHEYNNPFGRERSSFNTTMRSNLIAFIERIKMLDSKFVCYNFDELDLSWLSGDDMVYCDPPYLITTGTYNDGKRGFTGWSQTEEKNLLALLTSLDNKGVKFALSNVLCHKGRENRLLIDWINYCGYNQILIDKNYNNSNYHTSKRPGDITQEVLITNYN